MFQLLRNSLNNFLLGNYSMINSGLVKMINFMLCGFYHNLKKKTIKGWGGVEARFTLKLFLLLLLVDPCTIL